MDIIDVINFVRCEEFATQNERHKLKDR